LGAETGLLPNVGFYGSALFPRVVDRRKPVPFAPELAVEVASPEQDSREMAAKAWRYLRGWDALRLGRVAGEPKYRCMAPR